MDAGQCEAGQAKSSIAVLSPRLGFETASHQFAARCFSFSGKALRSFQPLLFEFKRLHEIYLSHQPLALIPFIEMG